MVREIVHDPVLLSMKSSEASTKDAKIAEDLIDTLKAHLDECVGMAANMIGVRKRIIVMAKGPMIVAMLNPVILSKSGEYETEEGCLSLDGVRKTKRFRKIKVQYQDESFQKHTQDYEGEIAQIIQHECDHMDGVII